MVPPSLHSQFYNFDILFYRTIVKRYISAEVLETLYRAVNIVLQNIAKSHQSYCFDMIHRVKIAKMFRGLHPANFPYL